MTDTLPVMSADTSPRVLTRADILTEARAWLNTPFSHRASVRGAGVDCVGLVRGVWRNLLGEEPFKLPVYTTDWRVTGGEDTLTEAMFAHFCERPIGKARGGDVLVFRLKAGAPTRHCGILTDRNTLIHAYFGRGVVETHMVSWWQRRIAFAFAFPDLKDHPTP